MKLLLIAEYNVDNRQNQAVCDFNQTAPPGKACEVDLKNFGDCSPTNKFGYHTSAPCVYLKLNRVSKCQCPNLYFH